MPRRASKRPRASLESLLRQGARPALAPQRRREIDCERLLYASVKPDPGSSLSRMRTSTPLLDRLMARIPPPHKHRHRDCGALAANSPLRAATPPEPIPPATAPVEPLHRKAARYS